MTEGWRGWDDYAPFYDWENAQTVARRDVKFWQRLAAAQDGSRCRWFAAVRGWSASIDPHRC
jgi:hypothetical protein